MITELRRDGKTETRNDGKTDTLKIPWDMYMPPTLWRRHKYSEMQYKNAVAQTHHERLMPIVIFRMFCYTTVT